MHSDVLRSGVGDLDLDSEEEDEEPAEEEGEPRYDINQQCAPRDIGYINMSSLLSHTEMA